MFFILSKILQYAVQPVVIVSLLLLISVLLRNARWKRITRNTGIAGLLFFTNPFLANEVVRAWELPAPSYASMKPYRAAVLLTGVARSNSTGPSDRVYLNGGADRVTHTVQLYKLGLVQEIIVSGGSGKVLDDGSRESLLLRNLMITMGVPDSVIHTDASSDNTYENAVESRKLIDSLGIAYDQCLLVTSAFHMRRALACFRKAGLDIDYLTCDFRGSKRMFTPDAFIIPKQDAMVTWQKLFKEWAGFVAYKLAGYI